MVRPTDAFAGASPEFILIIGRGVGKVLEFAKLELGRYEVCYLDLDGEEHTSQFNETELEQLADVEPLLATAWEDYACASSVDPTGPSRIFFITSGLRPC